MNLTKSYALVIPPHVLERYEWAETRNAAGVMRSTNREQFDDLIQVLTDFRIDPTLDIFPPGGNESLTAGRLNGAFRNRGWREGDYKVAVSSVMRLLPYAPAGEVDAMTLESEGETTSYLIDNVKGRVAVDVEWHAKDGNLDRDLAAYRSLYDSAIIDTAAVVTMKRTEMRAWALELDANTKKFATSTTTNLEKLIPRLVRGDGGGCPILVAAICGRTS